MRKILSSVLFFTILFCGMLSTNVLAEEENKLVHEHRGFYYSANVAFDYTFFQELQGERNHEGKLVEIETSRIRNYSLPILGIRLGRSFGNLIAFYEETRMGWNFGKRKNKRETAWDVYEENSKRTREFTLYLSLGSTQYPFRDKNSVMNGFFIGESVGFLGSVVSNARDHHTMDSEFLHFEVGKDWWVSDTWSVGCGLGYSFYLGTPNEDKKVTTHAIQLMFRITRG